MMEDFIKLHKISADLNNFYSFQAISIQLVTFGVTIQNVLLLATSRYLCNKKVAKGGISDHYDFITQWQEQFVFEHIIGKQCHASELSRGQLATFNNATTMKRQKKTWKNHSRQISKFCSKINEQMNSLLIIILVLTQAGSCTANHAIATNLQTYLVVLLLPDYKPLFDVTYLIQDICGVHKVDQGKGTIITKCLICRVWEKKSRSKAGGTNTQKKSKKQTPNKPRIHDAQKH